MHKYVVIWMQGLAVALSLVSFFRAGVSLLDVPLTTAGGFLHH